MVKAAVPPSANLILLFTYEMSLQVWEQQGYLDRELRYYRIMQDKGLRSVVLMTYAPEDAQYQSTVSPILVLPKRRFNNNLVYSLLAPFVHWSVFRSAHIIKSNQSRGAWTGLAAKLLMPRKKLFIVRCGWVRTEEMMRRDEGLDRRGIRRSKLVEWLCFRFSDAIFVTTSADKQYIESTYRIHPDKIEIIPNSVDTDIFVPSDHRRNWAGPIKLISVGKLVPMKNFQSLILAAKGVDRCTEIVLVGDGPYKETLMNLSEQEQVNVTFLSCVPNNEIPRHLQAADIFIMPQLYGAGMSKVILEAMACGLITIGSNIQPHREVLADGVNGFLCNPDPASIRQCLERVLSMSPSTLNAISARARQDVLDKYSMRTNARRELEIFASLRRKTEKHNDDR